MGCDIESNHYALYYKLENKLPVAICREEAFKLDDISHIKDRRIASSGFRVWQYRKPKRKGYKTAPKRCSVWVSTVFLLIDHNYMNDGPPILFETMVFFQRRSGRRSPIESEQRRYATYAEAEIGHEQMIKDILKLHRKT